MSCNQFRLKLSQSARAVALTSALFMPIGFPIDLLAQDQKDPSVRVSAFVFLCREVVNQPDGVKSRILTRINSTSVSSSETQKAGGVLQPEIKMANGISIQLTSKILADSASKEIRLLVTAKVSGPISGQAFPPLSLNQNLSEGTSTASMGQCEESSDVGSSVVRLVSLPE